MDGLLIGLIDAGQQHQDFHLLAFELLARPYFGATAVVNGINDGPRQREEGHLIAFERQQPVSTNELTPIVVLERRIEHLRLELNDLIASAAVRNTELKRLHTRIWRNDRLPAEGDRCRRPREARKQQPRRERLIHEPDERLDRDNEV